MNRYYELRRYTPVLGMKRRLQERFERAFLPLLARRGVEVVGVWDPISGVSSDLVYMLAFPTLDEREEFWKALAGDPEWQAVQAETEGDGPLIAAIAVELLRVAPSMAGRPAGSCEVER